ncbi:MAG: hypothetical protein QXI58_01550 [Candidatus Micrarchaeia archaeon]
MDQEKRKRESLEEKVRKYIDGTKQEYLGLLKKLDPLVEEYKKLNFMEKLHYLTDKNYEKRLAAITSLRTGIKTFGQLNLIMRLYGYEEELLVKMGYRSTIDYATSTINLNKEQKKIMKEFYKSELFSSEPCIKEITLSALPILPFNWDEKDEVHKYLEDFLYESNSEWRRLAAIAISRMNKNAFKILYRAFLESNLKDWENFVEPIVYSVKSEKEKEILEKMLDYMELVKDQKEEIENIKRSIKLTLKLYGW